jgi:tetratricopeptide (TPR) repeat protein
MRSRVATLAVVLAVSLVFPVVAIADDSAGHLASAKAHLEKREFDKTIADCNKAIASDFNSAEAYNLRARARIGQARGRETIGIAADERWLADCTKALNDCDEALAINPHFADAYVSRARVEVLRGELKKAVDDCDKALALDPGCANAYCTRAGVRVLTGENDKVIADSDRALAIDPNLAEAYDSRGSAWVEKGEYDKALADCGRALKLDPGMAVAHLNIGLVWAHRGDQDKAVAEYKHALSITPDSWKALNDLGVAHWILAQTQERNAAVAEAAGDEKTAKECRDKVVALKKEARNYWTRGITLRPTAVDIYSNLGYAYTEAASQTTGSESDHNLDLAEQHLRKAVELKPTSPRPRNNLGRVLLRQSQMNEIAAGTAEIKGKTDPAQAAKAKQFRAGAKAKLDEAIAQFEQAVRLDPSLLEAHLNLGEVFTQLHELDKAERQYKEIVRFEPPVESLKKYPDALANFSQAHYGLARIALARKEIDEAVGHLQRALKLNPGNAAAMQQLAIQEYQTRDYDEAEKLRAAWLAKLPPSQRSAAAEQFVKQLDDAGDHIAAEEARKAVKISAASTGR